EGKQVKILCVGRKGRDALRRQLGSNIVETIEFRNVRRIGFSEAQVVSRKVFDLFNAGEFDVATLFYSNFKNVISQVPTAVQLIPAQIDASAADAGKKVDLGGAIYDYEPEEAEILDDLLPRNIS